MKNDDTKPGEQADAARKPAYEPPVIEEAITPEEMEREVHYAGHGTELTG